jgi:glycosyltransferase involved in cell wall biosynthesis
MSIHNLTIIVPVYNEQESLEKFKQEMDKFLTESPINSKIFFVDDGSKDESLQLIKEICKQDANYCYLSLAENHGLSTAIKAGIDHTETDLLGYIDSDLQTSPSDFLKFIPYLEDHEMVNGIRADRNDTLIKKMSSRIANSFRRLVINDGIRDTCCPLKIIKTDYAKNMPFFKGMHRFIPALIQLQGGKVKQIEIRHFERFAGTAKYKLLNRLIGPFFDTLAFFWMKKRKIRYIVGESNISNQKNLHNIQEINE